MVIQSPRDELPPLAYAVSEEQPPYSTGHQNLRTFTKLFIHNIDFQISRDSLLRVFNQFGRIKNINMPIDGRGRPRGLAFITYINHELAETALKVSKRGIKLG
jgi:RNA recognition motif-containing protein